MLTAGGAEGSPTNSKGMAQADESKSEGLSTPQLWADMQGIAAARSNALRMLDVRLQTRVSILAPISTWLWTVYLADEHLFWSF